MTDQDLSSELISHLQLDVAARRPGFAEFLQNLDRLKRTEGAPSARAWACRAVHPLLDYSSLAQLHRFVVRETAGSAPGALRLAIVGGPTTLQLRRLIELFLAADGIAAEVYEGDYGLFRQEILTDGSRLDLFRPEILFVATGARDVARFPGIDSGPSDVESMAAAEIGDWIGLWRRAHARWNATIIQNNFEIEPQSTWGHFALRHAAAKGNYLGRLNRMLAEEAPACVVLHDMNGLAAEAGAANWFDPRFYGEFKLPCAAECLPAYAHSVVSVVRALRGRSRKVLALDLDNTLWGGVVGDVGAGGIVLGQGSGAGEAFAAFQHYLKELAQRGIVLAVCSKNDPEKAREPFERRADMVLGLSDVACFVANWDNKADNLRRISEQLNLNLDSFVFVDDNPAERALVRRLLPEVAVPELPDDPAASIQAVARHRYFETTSFTRDDAARTRYYAEESRRKQLAATTGDLDSFLKSLAMQMKVEPIHELNIERATQLINKSNQFNLTTHRYTLAELRAIAADPAWRTRTFSLRDSLGDNGLISVILLRKQGEAMSIDTWVMSCRVLQRGVERFARNELVELSTRDGCDFLLGTYRPTAKNGLVANHFAQLGFLPAGDDNGVTSWRLAVGGGIEPLPHFIEREPSP